MDVPGGYKPVTNKHTGGTILQRFLRKICRLPAVTTAFPEPAAPSLLPCKVSLSHSKIATGCGNNDFGGEIHSWFHDIHGNCEDKKIPKGTTSLIYPMIHHDSTLGWNTHHWRNFSQLEQRRNRWSVTLPEFKCRKSGGGGFVLTPRWFLDLSPCASWLSRWHCVGYVAVLRPVPLMRKFCCARLKKKKCVASRRFTPFPGGIWLSKYRLVRQIICCSHLSWLRQSSTCQI
jgi:hypothetical protein